MRLFHLIIFTYEKIFYSIYAVISKGEKESPTTTSIIILSFVHFLNIFEIAIILAIFTGFPLTSYVNKISTLTLGFVCILINSIILYSHKRHRRIITKLKDKNVSLKFSWFYILFSILLIFILAPLLHSVHG